MWMNNHRKLTGSLHTMHCQNRCIVSIFLKSIRGLLAAGFLLYGPDSLSTLEHFQYTNLTAEYGVSTIICLVCFY